MSGPTKLQRWLDLIACLVGHRFPVSADELMASVPGYADGWNSTDPKTQQSTRRKFERDKDELRALGIPIRTIRYSVNHGEDIEGYQIEKRDFYLPYLRIVGQVEEGAKYADKHRPSTIDITDEEAPLALHALMRVAEVPGFPLANESRSAFRKLGFALDLESFKGSAPVLFVDRPGVAEMTQKVRTLSDALKAKKQVAFTYHGIYRGETTQRDVSPYGLMFQHGHWYLVGHDAMREDIRVFRVGRMENLEANTKKPGTRDYEVPKDFKLSAYGNREPWELGERDEKPLEALVRFEFPLSLWAERNKRGTLVESHDDGAQTRRFDLLQVEPFLRWLLTLDGEAVIVAPDSLRDELRTHARAVADAHSQVRQ